MQEVAYECCYILNNTNCNRWLPITADPVVNLHTSKMMASAVNALQMLTAVMMACAVSKHNH